MKVYICFTYDNDEMKRGPIEMVYGTKRKADAWVKRKIKDSPDGADGYDEEYSEEVYKITSMEVL